MMIKLNGYRAAVPNEIYYRDGLMMKNSKRTEIKNLITLQKYSSPTLDDVMSLLSDDARHCLEMSQKMRGYLEFANLTDTQKVLSQMGRVSLGKIASKDSGAVKVLSQHSKAKSTSSDFLRVAYWTIPSSVAEMLSGKSQWAAFLSSDNLFNSDFGMKMDMEILLKRSIPPSRRTLRELIKAGTVKSGTLNVQPESYSIPTALKVIDAIHPALWNPADYSKIPDISSRRKENEALYTASYFLDEVKTLMRNAYPAGLDERQTEIYESRTVH